MGPDEELGYVSQRLPLVLCAGEADKADSVAAGEGRFEEAVSAEAGPDSDQSYRLQAVRDFLSLGVGGEVYEDKSFRVRAIPVQVQIRDYWID